jgi:hypothetical protein
MTNSGPTSQGVGTNPNQTYTWRFSASVVGAIQWDWEVPPDWASGAVTVVVHYAKSVLGAGDIVHSMNYCSQAIGDALNKVGTDSDQTVAVAADPQLRHQVITWAALFTPSAVGEIWRFNYTRKATDAADTYASSSDVFGVELQYQATPNP